MRQRANLICGALLLCMVCLAQNQPSMRPYPAFSLYSASGNLTSTAHVVTLQLPAAATQAISFACPDCGVSIYCSVACDASIELNGTAASAGSGATTQTVNCINALCAGTLAVTGWSTSNTSGGTQLNNIAVPASIMLGVGLSSTVVRPSASSATNITVRTTAITGSARVAFIGELIKLAGNP